MCVVFIRVVRLSRVACERMIGTSWDCARHTSVNVDRRMFRSAIPWDHHTARLVDRHGLLGHGLRSLLASPGYTHACAIADWHVLGGRVVCHAGLCSRCMVRSVLACLCGLISFSSGSLTLALKTTIPIPSITHQCQDHIAALRPAHSTCSI